MVQKQFDEALHYSACQSILKNMLSRGIFSPTELKSPRQELLMHYDAPEGAPYSEPNKLS